jgi:hypothetical protein
MQTSSSNPELLDLAATSSSTISSAGNNHAAGATSSIVSRSGLARRKFLAMGAVGAMGSIVAGATGAFGATKKKVVKKVAPKTASKTAAQPTATKLANAAPTVAPTAAATGSGSTDAAHGAVFSEAQEVAISFAFVNTQGGGRFHNPYVAVWIEDANESLIRNVSLNYQVGRGERWLEHLQRWANTYNRNEAALGANRIQEVTGPTRIPGTFSYAWDGRDEAKNLVPHGSYYVCIEAAVEKGSYQLIREALPLTGAPVSKSPADNGDLQHAKFELRARK